MGSWETYKYTIIYFDLYLECDPRDKKVILIGEEKGTSTASAEPCVARKRVWTVP